MTLIVERALEADIDAVHEVIQCAFRREAERVNNPNIQPLQETTDDIRTGMTRWILYVARLNGRIIGTGRAIKDGNTTIVGRLAVLPEYQRKGVASQLIKAIEAAYPETPRLEVFTSHTSLDNIALYEKHGYKIHGYKNAPAPDPTVLVFMEKYKSPAK